MGGPGGFIQRIVRGELGQAPRREFPAAAGPRTKPAGAGGRISGSA